MKSPYFASRTHTKTKTMHAILNRISNVTSKGQVTVPKAIRDRLGIGYGGRIAFCIEGDQIVVHNPDIEELDPAIESFLHLIEDDISKGRNLTPLSEALVKNLRQVMDDVKVDLNEPLEAGTVL